MKTEVKSFAKINLSIDAGPRGDDGYHRVDMVMQQLSFHDDVTVEYLPEEPDCGSGSGTAPACGGSFDIEVSTNRYYLPVDRKNLAYQAAELMAGIASGADAGADIAPGKILIHIHKRIPVAGGLAGGSGNAAAVLHALNIIWDLGLSLSELMELGAGLGSDVPFCVMGQARGNRTFPEYIRSDASASSCARATGRGTELLPVAPLKSWIVIARPRLSVSTKEVYEGIDAVEIARRPDNDRLVRMMREKAELSRTRAGRKGKKGAGSVKPDGDLYGEFINVLEEYTLRQYPEVGEIKAKMLEEKAEFSLMSGSGPTVFGIFGSMTAARKAADALRESGVEAYWTRTTL